MENEKIIYDTHELMQMLSAFKKSRVLLTAVELDIFNSLDNEEMSAPELADKIDADSPALSKLLYALVSLELLTIKGNKFSNSNTSKKYFVKSGSSFLGGAMHQVQLWNSWNNLTDIVKSGQDEVKRKIYNREHDWLADFIAAMHARGVLEAQKVKPLINFEGVKKVLDLGGGSGIFASTFIRNTPSMHAIVFDLPNVIPLTEQYIAGENLTGRITTLEGNYLYDDIGSGYDLIFLSAVIHSNSYDENLSLMKKCANALNPNGRIVVMDFIMDEDRTRPVHGALFAINMLVNTEKGTTYTRKEIENWLYAAGLQNIEMKKVDRKIGLISGRLK